MITRAAVLSFALLAAGCATAPGATAGLCEPDLAPTRIVDLYFGRNIGDTLGVDEAEWAAFVDEEITPRFPRGLSVVDVAGQWRDRETGQIGREPSKAVTIVLSGELDERARLDAVRAAYIARFDQQAVMLVQRSGCVGF
jgi:hypothetical protein